MVIETTTLGLGQVSEVLFLILIQLEGRSIIPPRFTLLRTATPVLLLEVADELILRLRLRLLLIL